MSDEYYYMTPGESIAQFFKREHPNLSIAQGALKLGIDSGTLHRIIKGKRGISVKFAVRFDEIFDVPAINLLKEQAEYQIWKIKNNKENKYV